MYQLNDISTASYFGAEDYFQQSSEASASFCHYKNLLWNLTKQQRRRQEHFYLNPLSSIIPTGIQTQTILPHEGTT